MSADLSNLDRWDRYGPPPAPPSSWLDVVMPVVVLAYVAGLVWLMWFAAGCP